MYAGSDTPSVPPDEQIDLAVEVFRMLGDATRVRLLWAMLDGELSVGHLALATQKAPAAVSQHLAKLRMARLVQTRRRGTQIIYRIENDHVRQLLQDALHHAEHVGPDVPAHHRVRADITPIARTANKAAGENRS